MIDVQAQSLPQRPGVVYGETSLTLPDGLTYEQWESLGIALQAMFRACQWWVGDWFNYGESHFHEYSAQAVALATGREEATVWNCASIARRFPTSRRREVLTFAHHVEVAGLPVADQEGWLDLAEAEHLTRKQLRERVTGARTRGSTRPPSPLDEREPVQLPGEIIVEWANAEELPLAGESVDLIVTSPPYGLGIAYADSDDDEGYATYLEHVQRWATELHRVARENGRLCVNVPLDVTRGGVQPVYADWLERLKVAGWSYRFTIIWNEANVSKSVARGTVDSPAAPHVMAPVETVLVMHKGVWNLRRQAPHDLSHEEWLDLTNGVWTFPGAFNPRHPAPFPEELPRRCIKLLSFRGDVVLDPFLGSGTTAVVARALGRRFYGFDISPQYVADARAWVAEQEKAA